MSHVYRPMSMLDIHRTLSDLRWQTIRIFIDQTRQSMRTALKEFSNAFDMKTAGWSEDRIIEYADENYDDMEMLRDGSPQLLRYAQCILIYGTFEKAIADLCFAAHRDKRILESPPNRRDLNMRAVKSYLCSRIPANPNSFAEEWEWLDGLRVIRNWIAHQGGRIPKQANKRDKDRAKQFLQCNDGAIRRSKSGKIEVEDGLVDRATEMAMKASDRLNDAVGALDCK